MRYEIKSILKNKITWIFIFILLVISLKTLVENENINYSRQAIKGYAWNAAITSSRLEQEQSGFYSQKHTKKDTIWFQNFIAYEQWQVDESKRISELFQKKQKSADKEEFILNLILNICSLNQYSNEKEGNMPASKVFKDKLEKYKDLLKLDELPFDCEQLKGDPFTIEEDKAQIYNTKKFYTIYEFERLDANEKLSNQELSPSVFLSFILSRNQLTTILIGVFIIFFTTFVITEAKKSRSIQLIELVPGKKTYILTHYYISLFISLVIIIAISIGIPLFMVAIRHGFDGWNCPILVDAKGFTGFKPYTHGDDFFIVGISKAYRNAGFQGGISGELSYWPLGLFLITAFVVSFLKITFLSLVGFGVGVLCKKTRTSVLISICTSFIYGISQYVSFKHKWNPFSIKSGWDTTLGWTHMTWLNAVIVLLLSIVITIVIIVHFNNKRDFE